MRYLIISKYIGLLWRICLIGFRRAPPWEYEMSDTRRPVRHMINSFDASHGRRFHCAAASRAIWYSCGCIPAFNERTSAASDACSSVVYWKNLSARADRNWCNAFGELISPRLCIQFPGALYRGMGPFKLP